MILNTTTILKNSALPIHVQALYLTRVFIVDIPRFNSAYLSGVSPSIGTSSQPPENQSQDQPPTEFLSNTVYAVFHGDGTGLIMPQSETTDRMQAVIDRVDEASGRYLVSSGLFENEDFLSFTERMSDADLKNFAQTTKALRTPSDQLQEANSYSGISAIRGFFEDLQAMSGDTLSRVLEKTAELSTSVPTYDANPTYDALGKLPPGSAAVTPLHNFVKAIGTMGSDKIDEQANNLLDKLELYGGHLENTLLQVASLDSEIALQIMTQMQDYTGEAQEEVFSYLAKLTTSISSFSLPPPKTAANREPGEDGFQASRLELHDNSKEVVVDMMDTFSSLTENYLFTDEQITNMATDLSELDNGNQSAYLEITATGLNTLLRENEIQEQQAVPKEVLVVVDDLRSNSDIRHFVRESGRGDTHKASNGRTLYEVKGEGDSKQDKAQTIEVLTSNAWLNGTANKSGLVNSLRSVGADQRDELIDDLSSMNDSPLYSSSPEEQEAYKPLQERLDVISNTNDLDALLAAEEKLPDESVESFWSAASFLEQESDKFVEMINRSNTEGAQVLVGLIVAQKDAVEHEEMTYEEAQDRAQDILSAFSFD